MTSLSIIGGGSLGLLLGGKLSRAGCAVTIVTKTAEQAERLAEAGITIEDAVAGEPSVTVPIEAVAVEDASATDGLALLTVKQTALTDNFMKWLADIVPIGATVVLFQNGVGHVDKLRLGLPGRELLVAVTTEGALRTGPTTVLHTGKGEIRIGEWGLSHDEEWDANNQNSREDALKTPFVLESLFKQAGFTVILSNKLEEAVWRKLLINAVINPLTALLRVRNGQLPATRERMELMRALFDETYTILSNRGLAEERDALWQSVLAVCDSTKRNESSMLQDVLSGRETEVDAINGAVSRLAAEQGMKAPWNDAICALVKAT
ncbi:ketopantoate reductase family protein [Cohnella yongneupensis]|uniref:2-dehydropantoate 2-reductase n=1 Tax=Cohnella yongneupensis TaxID=425006 RepID=A0ABW0R4P9_9BACL